jgi:hypothetical protein
LPCCKNSGFLSVRKLKSDKRIKKAINTNNNIPKLFQSHNTNKVYSSKNEFTPIQGFLILVSSHRALPYVDAVAPLGQTLQYKFVFIN